MNFDKTKTATITLILMLTFSATILAFPIASAHEPPWEIPNWCYVSVQNNPIGVNQEELIIFWINAIPPTAEGAFGDRWTFSVEVTKPDGSKETLGPFTSDPIGGGYTLYTPTQVGTYTIVAKMAEHVITGLPLRQGGTTSSPDSVGDIYLASTSDPMILTVQQDPIESWTDTPLPTEYWTRPINEANRNWDVLAGNWLTGAAQNNGPTTNFGYGTGPESAHIMWTRPIWVGGIMDTRFGDIGYQTSHYEGLYLRPPIILNGKLYYNILSLPRYGWYCVDLYTGETEYFHNTTGSITTPTASSSGSINDGVLAFGQIFDYESPNQHGGMPYLWSTTGPEPNTWMMFDAFTGNYICSINNVPRYANPIGFGGTPATSVYGKDGSILAYNIANIGNATVPNYRLTCWNTTQAIWWKGTQQQYQAGDYSEFPSNSYWLWRPGLNVTYDGDHGFSLNVSIPEVQGGVYCVREGEFIIGGTPGKNNPDGLVLGNLWALSLKPGQEGTLLWNITFTPPQTEVPDVVISGFFGGGKMQLSVVDPEDGVFLFSESLTRRWWGYDLETGQKLWGPTKPEPAFNYYSMENNVYQGMLLSTGFGGVLIAYDIQTGKVLWNYTAAQIGFESPYGNCPSIISCIADGKIYLTTIEHSPTQPLRRGSYLRCINASNGAELWKVLYWGASMSAETSVYLADGFLVGLNFYDNQIYCFGKGPSQTTITGPDTTLALGEKVLIKGSVIDLSPGTQQLEQAKRFPNGVPAMADEYQEDWMEYVYQQQPCPSNAQGVKVKLYSIDPNGNYQDLGEVTTDLWGNYGTSWKPPVPGDYHVIAEFEGTASYWGSSSSTYFTVDEALTP